MSFSCLWMGKYKHNTQRDVWIMFWCGLYPTTSMWIWPRPISGLVTIFDRLWFCLNVHILCDSQRKKTNANLPWKDCLISAKCAIRWRFCVHHRIHPNTIVQKWLDQDHSVVSSSVQVTYKSWSTWTSGLSGTPLLTPNCQHEGAEISEWNYILHHLTLH